MKISFDIISVWFWIGLIQASEVVWISRQGQTLVQYGVEWFSITDKYGEVLNFKESANEKNCLRLGFRTDQCKYTFQFIHQITNSNVVACATSAGERNCYHIINGISRGSFQPDNLISHKPSDRPVTLVIDDNQGAKTKNIQIISISKDFQSNISLNLIKIILNKTETTGSLTGNTSPVLLPILNFKFHHSENYIFKNIIQYDDDIIISGIELGIDNLGIILHMCKNDIGKKETKEITYLFKIGLQCEYDGIIYKKMVLSRIISGSDDTSGSAILVGLFENDYQTESLICVYSRSELIASGNECKQLMKTRNDQSAQRLRLQNSENYPKLGLSKNSILKKAIFYKKNRIKNIVIDNESLYLIDSSGISKKSLKNGKLYHNYDQPIRINNDNDDSSENIIFWNDNLTRINPSSSSSLIYSQPLSCPYASCSQCYASHDTDCIYEEETGCIRITEMSNFTTMSNINESYGYESCSIDVNYENEPLNKNTPTVLIANLSNIQHYTGYNWSYNGSVISNEDNRFSQSENIGNGRLSLIIYTGSGTGSQLNGNYTLSVKQNQFIIFKKYISVFEPENNSNGPEISQNQTVNSNKANTNRTVVPNELEDGELGNIGGTPTIAALGSIIGIIVLIITVLAIRHSKGQNGENGKNGKAEFTPMLSDHQILEKVPNPETEVTVIMPEVNDTEEMRPTSAVIVFPDGSMKRINHKKLVDLKFQMDELDKNEEESLRGTLQRTLKHS